MSSFYTKKVLLSAAFIAVAATYSVWLRICSPLAPVSTTPSTPAPTSDTTVTPVTTQSTPPVTAGAYRDGSYTGTAVDAYYGTLQVKAVITDGKISDVVFLQYAHDQSTSIRVNTRAMPLLTQEAIVAQSAAVDGVSGATATSNAFRESLTAALAQAKA